MPFGLPTPLELLGVPRNIANPLAPVEDAVGQAAKKVIKKVTASTTAKPGAKPTPKTPTVEDKREVNKPEKIEPAKSTEKSTEKLEASFRGKKRDKVNLRYPDSEIHKDTDYLEITILKYQPAGFCW